MKLVILESPFAGNTDLNLKYANACIADCLARGESPIASHVTLTQALDDDDPDQRSLGLKAGWAWYRVAEACVTYGDLGISAGMLSGMSAAEGAGVPVEYRVLGGAWAKSWALIDDAAPFEPDAMVELSGFTPFYSMIAPWVGAWSDRPKNKNWCWWRPA